MPFPLPADGLSDGVIALRRFRTDDLDQLVAACQDPEIPRWTTVPSPYTREHGAQFLALCDGWWDAGTDLPFAIVDAHDRARLLGATGIHRIGADPDAVEGGYLADEVGYWLAASARGRGVATRAVTLVAAWGLGPLARPRLWLQCMEGNDRSRAVAERTGFTLVRRAAGAAEGPISSPTLVFARDAAPVRSG